MPATAVINRVSNFCQVMNRVGKISDFGLEKSNGFGKWAGHPPNSSWSIRHAQEKIMIIHALTKLVQSRWLNIGFVLFLCIYGRHTQWD